MNIAKKYAMRYNYVEIHHTNIEQEKKRKYMMNVEYI